MNEKMIDIYVIESNVRPYLESDPKFQTSYLQNMTTNLQENCF
jgi:hypothetical protein